MDGVEFAAKERIMMTLLLHATNAPHAHPDQLLVAAMIAVAIVVGSWTWQRRRS
jgi:hypothetical protein